MLARFLALVVCCAMPLIACQRVAESKLVGGWNGTSSEGHCEVWFFVDHKFTWNEWSFADPHQVPHGSQGEWHVRANKLLLDLDPELFPPEHTEFLIDIHDDNRISLYYDNGAGLALERLK